MDILTDLVAGSIRSEQAGGDETEPTWNSVPPPKRSYVGKKSTPAPRRDLSGVWDGSTNGDQDLGPLSMPEDGKPEHQIPLTPLGLERLKLTRPSNGPREVPDEQINDPVHNCDPMGFPRIEFHELRTIKLVQTADQVIYLNEYYGAWRIIWTDGRELPKDPDPRWYGYSVGKWVDDYTLLSRRLG